MKNPLILRAVAIGLLSISAVYAEPAITTTVQPQANAAPIDPVLLKRRADYSEIVNITAPYRVAVVECANTLHSLKDCNAGSNHIPTPITEPTGLVANLQVISGVITVTPVEKNGFVSADTYVSVPTITRDGTVTWEVSGGGVVKGYAGY